MANFELHSFYCINCGKKAIELPRKISHKHKDFHRKKLYCPWCKNTINCVEVKNSEQETIFKENFKNGVYDNERENSLDLCGDSWLG